MTETDEVKSKVSAPVRYWMGEISAARAREKDYRKEGKRVQEIYYGEKKDQTPFNILYSNTETLLPALYNSQPRPVVDRRFKDADPIGKAASQVGQRCLEYFVDTNSEEYATFDDVMADAVLDALLPGRGATRVKYDAETAEVNGYSSVTDEGVCFESIKWDKWIFGYAKKWKRVPWIALEHDVTKKEAITLFGATIAGKLTYLAGNESDPKETDAPKDTESDEQDTKTCKIYEIWDKAGGRRVRFIAEGYAEAYLKDEDDPLELTGFYPIPEPIRFLKKANDLMPTAIYALYENQAKELNELTVRINKVAKAIKVRGVYDSTIGEIADLLKKDDNTLVPAENVAALQDGGLMKAIWMMPLTELVTVLQQLYVAREACKKVIYEITGISDILRGSSAASETLGAQEIKQQWATLRLKRLQKEVARYARDLMRISLEVAGKHLQIKTLQKITGLIYPTNRQKQAANGQIAAARASGQQVNPMAQQVAQSPSWEDIQAALKDDTQRQYRIDIETNSTVDLEATEDQKQIAELMTAMAQFLQGVAPLIESGVLPFGAAQAMLLTIVRRYRFGAEVEDQIKQMQPPKPQDNGKAAAEQAKNQLMQQQQQHDQALAQQKQQQDQAQIAHDQQLEIMKFQYEQKADGDRAVREHQSKLAEIEADKSVQLAVESSKRATAERQAMIQQDTELRKATLAAATQIEIANINAKVTAAGNAASAAGEADASAAEGAQVAETSTIMTKILETQGKLLAAISAPKAIERDPATGKALRLVPQGV